MAQGSQIRVSQAERDGAVEALRGHAADGRLELDELEQRVEAALAARTRGELAEQFTDLPAPGPGSGAPVGPGAPAPPRRRARPRVPRAAALLLAVALVAGVVFATTGAAGWVMWAALGWGLFSLKTGRVLCAASPRRRHSTA